MNLGVLWHVAILPKRKRRRSLCCTCTLVKHRFYIAHESDRVCGICKECRSNYLWGQVLVRGDCSGVLLDAVPSSGIPLWLYSASLGDKRRDVRYTRWACVICSCHLMLWYLLCITAVYDLVHEFHVVFAPRFTGFKTFLERLESVPGHCAVR